MFGRHSKAFDWEQAYHDLLSQSEQREHAVRQSESALRRAANVLATAGLGQSASLDRALEHVLECLRDSNTARDSLTLERALNDFNDMLQQYPGGNAESAAAPETCQTDQLLLALAPGQPPRPASVQADASASTGAFVATDGIELAQLIASLERQLSRIQNWAEWYSADLRTGEEHGQQLETTVEEQLLDLQQAADAATGLGELQHVVESGLAAVTRSLHQFREQEAPRLECARERGTELVAALSHLRDRTESLGLLYAAAQPHLLLDAQTGINSRFAYERRLLEEFSRWRRTAAPVGYVLWAIDHFQPLIDRLGRDAGAGLLHRVSRFVDENKRCEDFLARVDSNGFVLLMPGADAAAAMGVAERIREAVCASPFRHQGLDETLTISCGITELREGDTALKIHARASSALAAASDAGHNTSNLR